MHPESGPGRPGLRRQEPAEGGAPPSQASPPPPPGAHQTFLLALPAAEPMRRHGDARSGQQQQSQDSCRRNPTTALVTLRTARCVFCSATKGGVRRRRKTKAQTFFLIAETPRAVPSCHSLRAPPMSDCTTDLVTAVMPCRTAFRARGTGEPSWEGWAMHGRCISLTYTYLDA